MSFPRQTERLHAANPEDIARAAHLLRTGHTVAFPTETVYGLGANALSPVAVEQIFLAKQRPHWDPLIVHIASPDQLPQIAQTSPLAEALITRFWPGPLTLLLPRTQLIPDIVTAGRELVGVRQPRHPVALELLRQAGIPVAAPSANTFSHTSPTTARHVLDDLDGRIDAILDGGPTEVGLESTVAEPSPAGLIIYRLGAVTIPMLEAALGPGNVHLYIPPAQPNQTPTSLPSPGVGLRHYAPRARLVLVDPERFRVAGPEALLSEASAFLSATRGKFGVMLPDGWLPDAWLPDGRLPDSTPFLYPWGPWEQPEILARRLFAGLRALDDRGVEGILCPLPPGPGLAEAIRDRLQKAAKP